ncbi:MAG: AraC family transcriptional regulator [Bacteroidales bacterium]|nr:AraC family transcriptional regulator [Bacteroidales bacterium]
MKVVDIKNLKQENWVQYNDGDIIIIDNISILEKGKFAEVSVNMVAMIFCLKGSANVVLNGNIHRIMKNDVLICSPDTLVDKYALSKDFDAKIIGFSVDAVDTAMYISKNVWHNLYYVFQNPVIHLKEDDMRIMINYYYIAEAKLSLKNNLYYREIIHSLLSCLIYEFLVITDRYIINNDSLAGNEIKQGDLLFKRFIELLAKEKGMIRSVAQAAERLHVSGKYLSTVIKSSSGKKALEIIHHYTTQEIIRRLKYTDKSIQEICNDMNFPSLSFFGKFFKNQTGLSPKQYRKCKDTINN